MKALKVFALIVAALFVLIVGGAAVVLGGYPKAGPMPNITASNDPAVIARGEYLANHVMACMDCHSQRDWTKLAGPLKGETFGAGGERFGPEMGLPGILYSANITPAALASVSDAQLAYTIMTGVNHEGRAIFPLMPYQSYGKADLDDITAVVSYLRTLAPISSQVPPTKLEFPMNMIVRTIPQPAQPGHKPDPSQTVAYGGYMVRVAACMDCHTPTDDKGQQLPGMDLAGGMEFLFPGGTVRSANITPDMKTGIGNWSREEFIYRFKGLDNEQARNTPAPDNGFNTPMPWLLYAGMTEDDLGAIYDYLRTVPAIEHEVEHFTPNAKTATP